MSTSFPAAHARKLRQIQREIRDIRNSIGYFMKVLKLPGPKSRRELVKRLLDGMVLYQMKDYDKAAILFMDLVTGEAKTRPGMEARFYLGDCLYLRREYLSAKAHFRAVVEMGPTVPNYQKALQRLLELSLRTGDHTGIYQLIERIRQIPQDQRDQAMDYVLAKYYFFRELLAEARKVFLTIPGKSPYFQQSRYFLGVIAVKQGKPKDAEAIFKASLTTFAEMEKAKKTFTASQRMLYDLFILGLARLHTSRNETEKAIDLYKAVSRRSRFFDDALYELSWAYLRSREFGRSIRVLELLVLAKPDHWAVPESKILLANLKLLSKQYYNAKRMFKSVARRYRPVYLQIRQFQKMQLPPVKFYYLLLGKGHEALDMKVDLPKETFSVLKRQPQVRKALRVIGDLEEIRTNVRVCERIIRRIERRIGSTARISAFPELARARAHSVEMEIKLTKLSGELMEMLKTAVSGAATPSEQAELAQLADRRRNLEQLIQKMPSTTDAFEKRVAKIRKMYESKEAEAHKIRIALDALRATLTATENYFHLTRDQQKIDAGMLKTKVKALKEAIHELEEKLDAVRDVIVDAKTVAGIDDSTMEEEKRVRARYKRVLTRQKQLYSQVVDRLSGGGKGRAERVARVAQEAEDAGAYLVKYNERIEKLLAYRLGRVRRILAEEKVNIRSYKDLLKEYEPETREVAGGVTQEGFKAVSREFYKLVIKADVGVLDVAWAVKSDLSDSWARTSQVRSRQLEDLEKRFREVRSK